MNSIPAQGRRVSTRRVSFKTEEKTIDLGKHQQRKWGFKKRRSVGNKKFGESYFFFKKKCTQWKETIVDSTKRKKRECRDGK